MKTAYFDLFAGASGDMILGALLDAGLSLESLAGELSKLHLSGYHISAEPQERGMVSGTQVTIDISQTRRLPLDEMVALIRDSSLSGQAREKGMAIFQRLGEAEARAHRIPIKEVHLHELGSLDTIIDIMGAVVGLELLGVERVYCSPFPSGSGAVSTQEGVLPVPAPATLELIATAGAPIRPSPSPDAELVTPTGAAILTTLASFSPPTISLERVGCGVGSRHLVELPNIMRVWIGEEVLDEGDLLLFETNIDDMSPEVYGYVMERLFEEGAADVWLTPIQMKKNRPATMLSILAPRDVEGRVVEVILSETSTLGVRIQPLRRHVSEREAIEFNSSLGRVRVKIKRLYEKGIRVSPEFEDCRRIAIENHIPLQRVYQIIEAEAQRRLSE